MGVAQGWSDENHDGVTESPNIDAERRLGDVDLPQFMIVRSVHGFNGEAAGQLTFCIAKAAFTVYE